MRDFGCERLSLFQNACVAAILGKEPRKNKLINTTPYSRRIGERPAEGNGVAFAQPIKHGFQARRAVISAAGP